MLDVLRTIERFVEAGQRVHPLNGKVAVHKDWPNIESAIEDVRDWHAQGFRSFGLITDKAAVLDFDDTKAAREFFKEHQSIIKTRRGVHFYFRNPGHIGNAVKAHGKWDIRGNNGYVVCPGSIVDGWQYQFVKGYDEWNPALMEPFRDEWLPHPSKLVACDLSGDTVLRAREYLKTIEGAVSGQRGHDTTFRVACVLTQKFGLSHEQAYPLLLEWNEKCQPKWSSKELLHKLEDSLDGQSVRID